MSDNKIERDDGDIALSDRRGFIKKLGLAAAGVGGAAALAGCTPTQPLARRDVPQWDATTDLIVVGTGVAGTAAAIEARRLGAEVFLLEKFHVPGGSSSLSGGVCYMGGGTPLQKLLGFSDTTEAMYDYMMASSGLYAQQEKIQHYCEGSLEQFQWMTDNGIVYSQEFSDEKELTRGSASLYYSGNEKAYPYRELGRPAPRGHCPSAENQTGGRRMMQALLASAEKLGVQIKLRVSAERLIVESDGSVSGLQVNDNGTVKHLRARKGVVLAAGGFIHNREMARLYAPELFECTAPWGRAGDLGEGILMGLGIGARALRMDQGFAILPLYPAENVLKGIIVNAHGQRFITEDSYYAFPGHDIAFHQNGLAYLIVDKDSDYPWPNDFRISLKAQANSIRELEQALKMPEGMLQHTAEYYSRHARAGKDPLFNKDAHYLAPLAKAPFKAYELSRSRSFFAAATFGGLHTSLDSEVFSVWGKPIPGLYAAGRTAASIPVSPYIASGVSVGDGVFTGRRAARHALQRKA
jgi:succinate dehydrogenase/fumarate reductase flavoprotein subunit